MARVYSSTSVATTLAASLSNIATSLTVTSGGGGPLIQGSGFTNGDIFTIAIDPDTQTEEICFVTANSGDVFTVTRGQAGSSAVAHASGATVRHVLTSSDLVFFRDGVTTANAAVPASTLTTKGDLLTRTSASLARLGVGSNGQVLAADSTATTGMAWTTFSANATPRIGQVVSATSATDTTSTSSSWVDMTNITLSITPTLSTSKVLINFTFNLKAELGSTTDVVLVQYRIVRGSTAIYNGYFGEQGHTSVGAYYYLPVSLTYLDSPATTSSTTYKLQMQKVSATAFGIQNSGSSSSITLQEVLV